MHFLEESEIEEYVKFLKQYYSFSDIKLCIGEASESEWKLLYTGIRKGVHALDTVINEGMIDSSNINEHAMCTWHGTHDENDSYKNNMGYFIPTNNLMHIITAFWNDNETTRTFRKKLQGTEYFIMLRIQCAYLRTKEGYLDTLFHEILHTIEIESHQRIFRGDSIQQEARDTLEIVMPYVKLFIKEKK